MRFIEPSNATVDAEPEELGVVPDILSATGAFSSSKSEFLLDPPARYISQVLRYVFCLVMCSNARCFAPLPEVCRHIFNHLKSIADLAI